MNHAWFLLIVSVTLVHAQDGCKAPAQLSGPGGSFSTPYYDFFPAFKYPAGLTCRWTITVPEDKRIRVTIENPISLSAHVTAGCADVDYFGIFEANRGNDITICSSKAYIAGPYCPTDKDPVPTSFVIPRHSIDVEFCSNAEEAFRGFKLTYAVTEDPGTVIPTTQPFVCGGTVTMVRGTPQYIQTPFYPSDYPRNVVCTWDINAPTGYPLTFTAETFDVEGQGCIYDSLTFLDQTVTGAGSNLGLFCGSYLFIPITSTGNRVKVVFKSDELETRSGFRIRVDVGACPSGSDRCPNVDGATRCVRPNQLCDGVADCPGGTDEVCPAGCGVPAKTPLLTATRTAARIVGGVEAKPHSWPWQALMLASEDRQLCGGSIIDHHWILTAAQCCLAVGAQPYNYVIRVGDHDINGALEAHAWTYAIERVIPHPGYDSSTQANDICLLKTKQPILFNDDVHPVCLAFGAAPPVGQDCYVTGWGVTTAFQVGSFADVTQVWKNGTTADRSHGKTILRARGGLRQADVKISDKNECQKAYGTRPITGDMMCAYNPGKDRCELDTGGPLVCQSQADRQRWELVGIASWGDGCAKPSVPGVYVDVFHFADWISDTVLSD